MLAARVGILVDAPLTKADILAASGETAIGNVVVSPNGASLRRLVRMRNAAPAPELPSVTIVRLGG